MLMHVRGACHPKVWNGLDIPLLQLSNPRAPDEPDELDKDYHPPKHLSRWKLPLLRGFVEAEPAVEIESVEPG